MKFKIIAAVVALTLIAGAAALTLSSRAKVVLADSGGNVEATYTKWIVGPVPNGNITDMVGVVGGSI
ncbi:MAG TPA: hypothetical protein VKT80_08540, partial [Chloroflexota bacterium]|nr:hypothetical protein [Chloroflexota bacterium]